MHGGQLDQRVLARTFRPSPGRVVRLLALAVAAAASLTCVLMAPVSGTAHAATQEPCDIYAAGGTPCVAAHSTTRALYAAYNGPLYQVRRSSTNTTTSIYPVSAGSYANSAAQDSFCSGTTCVITRIYDQSGHGNDLTQAPGGGAAGGPDGLANATAAPVYLNGHKVYGVYSAVGDGYRNDYTSGIATGDEAEGMYAVLDGTHYNSGCCFDYGNAETSNTNTGNGHMEAIYYGSNSYWGQGAGNGPWIMADLENGLFAGGTSGTNSNNPSRGARFVSAFVKGQPNQFAIRGGDGQSGGVSTYYNGPRPSGYNPMHKEGAILLGIGGDNGKYADGTFYEGVMTSGYPHDADDNAVQANIVAAGYSTSGGGGSSGYVRIQNAATGLYIDGAGATSNGSAAKQWSSSSSTNQQWTIVTAGSYVELQNRATGLYLDGMGRTPNGSDLGQWSGSGSTNQQWTETTSGSNVRFRNRATGLYIDGMGRTSNGSTVGQWSSSGSTNQQWKIVS